MKSTDSKTKPLNLFEHLTAFLLLMLMSSTLVSAETHVSGKVEGTADEMVRVIVYADNFSRLEKTLATTRTDEAGNFAMSFEVSETSIAFLAVGLKRGEFYLKPGGTYKFNISGYGHAARTSVFDELPLDFTLEADDDSLNAHIEEFNIWYNNFLLSNNSRIYRGRDKGFIRDFIGEVQEKFGNKQEPFLDDYVKYSIASLEWISKMKNDSLIITEYFAGNPIAYNNIQYAEFFGDFFKNHFASGSIYTYDEMVGAINSGTGFFTVDRLIARDITLKDDPMVRELIGVSRISRKYHSPDVRKQNVMALLNQVHRNSKSAGNSLVAENTAVKLRELAYGTQAPSFYLIDANGEQRTLSDYHDRFILLYFTRDDCNPCTYYYQSLDRIQKEFEGKLTIVIISEQDGFKETVRYLQSRGFNWSVLDLGQDIIFLEKYNIRTFPSLVLINPNGTMASANVPLPEEGLDFFIRRFMGRYEKQNPQIIKE